MRLKHFAGAVWRKATASDNQGNCVEIARVGDTIGMRDSKDGGQAPLLLSRPAFDAFTAGVRAGDFD